MNKMMKDYSFDEIFNKARIYLCDTDFTTIPENAITKTFGAFTAVVSITDFSKDISGIIQKDDIERFDMNPDRFYLAVFGRQIRWENVRFDSVNNFVRSMFDEFRNIMETSAGVYYEKEDLFYLTSAEKNASMAMYPGILQDIYIFLGEDFYILPSSKMEFLVIRESVVDKSEDLVKMVQDTNECMGMNGTNMMLSDKVHFYSHTDGNIHIC